MTAQQYYNEICDMFDGWKRKVPSEAINHQDSIFVKDGIVCPEKWFFQAVRPLYLLKEAYGGEADWDLTRDLLLQDGNNRRETWKRISKWTRGLMETDEKQIAPYVLDDATMHDGNSYLRQIAVVNVKKSDGNPSSTMKEINQYAEYDQKELYKEIQLIDPTVIICGYTISSLNIIMGKSVKDYKQKNPNQYYELNLNEHRVIVLDYYHPANHYPDIMNYYGLMGSYQQAMRKQEGRP